MSEPISFSTEKKAEVSTFRSKKPYGSLHDDLALQELNGSRRGPPPLNSW